MKKAIVALGVVIVLASCGNSTGDNPSDSTDLNTSATPMGDTANQISTGASSFPADSSNRNGNDSVTGTNPATRTTTPGNDSGQGGRRE